MLIDIIAGARPNFMKIAPIIRQMQVRRNAGGPLRFRLVHTGQHYDRNMSGDFFEQLGIPEPDVNLAIGSGTQAEQTAGIMVAYERLLLDAPCALTLVVGDVTSTMACAIAAQKLHIPVAHVEAGIRSGDWTMPEEINRIVTDAITSHFFTTTASADGNLLGNGVDPARIHRVGNTMIDTLVHNLDRLRAPDLPGIRDLPMGGYFVTTLHRPGNVDDGTRFRHLIEAIADGAGDSPVVFPVHPRTAKMLADHEDLTANFHLLPPLPYLEFNWLVRNAMGVVTDSGGISEETTFLDIPCLTLRDTTERPETVELGTNELVGDDLDRLRAAMAEIRQGRWKSARLPDLWDGQAAQRIVSVLENLVLG